MNKENTEKLWKTFPLLYTGRRYTIRQSLIPFGFECGDGWFDLIWDLSAKLEPMIEKITEENKRERCYRCGCRWIEHRHMPSRKRICTKVHKFPYRIGKSYGGCCIPQWKRDMGHAWAGRYWDTDKSRPVRLWKMFKKLLREDWKYTKYRNLDQGLYKRINWVLAKLQKIGLEYEQPCMCNEYESPYPRASQVKEKFGTLSFYMSSATDEMYELIREAERQSAHICEDCGAEGELREGGWIRTLCDKCEDNYQQKRIRRR